MKNLRVWLVSSALLCAGLLTGGAQAQCTGDCDDDGAVTVRELMLGLNITLGKLPLSHGSRFDADGNGVPEAPEAPHCFDAGLVTCP